LWNLFKYIYIYIEHAMSNNVEYMLIYERLQELRGNKDVSLELR
jgi:hypothetical protein